MILVAGASGLVGRALIEVLQSGRRPWIELARSPRPDAGDDETRRAVAADATDPEALARAAPDVRSIVHLAGVAPGARPARPDQEVAAMRALLELARARGVDRFVFLSATAASPDSSHPWLRAKGEAEALLQASGVPFVILRASLVSSAEAPVMHALMQVVRSGTKLRLPLLRAGRVAPIAAGDVAIALAAALDHHRMVGATIDVGTPPDLSLEELLALVAARLGVTLRRSRWPFAGSSLASQLRRVEQAPLPEADAFLALFALLEPPSLAEHDRLIPMRRVPLADELREYPWGEAPRRVRPGELLPTVTPAASSLPLFIPSDGQRGIASRFGRTDELGRVEPDERSPHGAHRPRDDEPDAHGDERDIRPLPRK